MYKYCSEKCHRCPMKKERRDFIHGSYLLPSLFLSLSFDAAASTSAVKASGGGDGGSLGREGKDRMERMERK